MNSRSIWITILLLVLSGLVKAQWHFIKLAMLGGMGLGGLWIIHKLAQDFNKIRNPKSAEMTKFLSKRSLDDQLDSSANWKLLNADLKADLNADLAAIIRQDPDGCAQRTLCHIAAAPRGGVGVSERGILKFIRHLPGSAGGPALDALRTAATLGADSKDFGACDRAYPKCPHSKEQIRAIFRFSSD